MYDTRNNGTSDGCIDDFCLEIILFCFACVCALALVIWLTNLLSSGICPSSLSPSSSNIFDLFFLPFLIWIFYTVEFIWRRKSHQKWLNMTNRSQLLTEFIGNPFFFTFIGWASVPHFSVICRLLSSGIFDYSIQCFQFAHIPSASNFWQTFKGDLRVVIVFSMYLSAFAWANIESYIVVVRDSGDLLSIDHIWSQR